MDTFRSAFVFVRTDFAGVLSETDEGYAFAYDAGYLSGENPAPVSLTLPLQPETYRSDVLFPCFDGLIPEGWLLDVVTRNWKLDARDRFGVLLVACKDPIGALSIREARS